MLFAPMEADIEKAVQAGKLTPEAAKALESLDRSRYPEEFAMLSDRIRELRPLLRVHGILDVMQIKNPEVAALIGV